MRLHIHQCPLCNKIESCEYRQNLFNTFREIEPKGLHILHNCTVFRKIFDIGDRVFVSVEVAYCVSENDYSGGGKIDKEAINGMATVIERSAKGRLLVVFDDTETAKHFAEMQKENKIGFYGGLNKGLYVDEFETLSEKGYPFWVWPKDIKKEQ